MRLDVFVLLDFMQMMLIKAFTSMTLSRVLWHLHRICDPTWDGGPQRRSGFGCCGRINRRKVAAPVAV